MLLWLFRISLLMFLLAACGRDKQTPPAAAAIEANFNSAIKTGNLDSAFESASLQLDQLRNAPDSLAAYIRCCYNLHDSVTKRAQQPWQWQQAKQLLYRIIVLQQQAGLINPALYLRATYNWAEHQYRGINPDIYNDTAARCLENALLLNKQYQALDSSSLRYANRILGIYYNKLGDPKKAFLYASREKELFVASTPARAILGNAINSSVALREMNLPDQAMAAAAEGTRLTNAASGRPDRLANAWTELAEAQLVKGMLADADKSVHTALLILDTMKHSESGLAEQSIRKGASLFFLGRLQMARGESAAAHQTMEEAVNRFRDAAGSNHISRDAGKVCTAMGYNLAAMNRYDSAIDYFRQALVFTIPAYQAYKGMLPPVQALYPENTIMEALDGMAAVLEMKFRQRGDTAWLSQAVQCYELAFAVEKKLLPAFSYDESLLRITRHSRMRSDKAIGACFVLYSQDHNKQWAEKAFFFAEMSKAVVLQESVKRNTMAASLLKQDTNWLKVQHLERKVAYFETALAEHSDEPAGDKALQNQLAAAESKLLEAKMALGVFNEAYREASKQTDSISAGLVRDRLPDHTALLEYFAGDSATYIFYLDKKAPVDFGKAGDELSEKARDLLAYFTDKNKILNDPAGYQEAAYRLCLYSGVAPVAAKGGKRIIIIPDGLLSYVPFDALITRLTSSLSPAEFHYLVREQQVSVEYSAAIMLKQMSRKPLSGGPMICFAPVFSNGERGNAPLLNSMQEAQQVKTVYPGGRYYLQREATAAQFRQQVQQAGIIHIATHASADTTGGRQPVIEFIDSSLYLTDIYALHINPELVVLSACQTGIGRLEKSEGVMSLARGFYYAGAQNVITSLWPVDDKSTADLLATFYRQAAKGMYAEALQQAKVRYLSSASVTYASPYYWAGFIHIGYQPADQGHSSLSLAWLFLPLVVAALLFWWLRRKN